MQEPSRYAVVPKPRQLPNIMRNPRTNAVIGPLKNPGIIHLEQQQQWHCRGIDLLLNRYDPLSKQAAAVHPQSSLTINVVKKQEEEFMLNKKTQAQNVPQNRKWTNASKHRTEAPIRLNSFTGATILGCSLAMAESESDK